MQLLISLNALEITIGEVSVQQPDLYRGKLRNCQRQRTVSVQLQYTILNFQNIFVDTNQKFCFVDGVKVAQFKDPLIALSSIKSASFTRNFSQPATQVKEEEEEIEIDQRRRPTDYDPTKFDPTKHRSPPTNRVWRLVDEMSSLTLAEVAELSSIMMKKMGMEPPVIVVMKGGVTKEDAEQIIEKMKAVGAKAVMQ
ncbi:50S ribosomal protein L7/L12 [Tanacetum coccineum]